MIASGRLSDLFWDETRGVCSTTDQQVAAKPETFQCFCVHFALFLSLLIII